MTNEYWTRHGRKGRGRVQGEGVEVESQGFYRGLK